MIRLLLTFALFAVALPAAEDLHLGRSLEQWNKELKSGDRTERLLAARALGEMGVAGSAGALDALTAALANKDSAVRFWAAIALGEMGDRAAAAGAALEKALQDPTPEVRVWAAYALARQGRADESVPVLIEVLGDPERGARLQAVTALDQLGETGRPAAEAMQQAVSDDFDYVGRIARHALWALGERPCPYRSCD
ncbi:MAG: HEAT repeat domain-containing protein [Acidobacteria bacterium]|nr:HEAT repeat domain-containing protein [Acidobacteriota bacterium]